VHRISGGEAGLVRAPAPAMVVAISVAAGDEVAEGDVVAVVESMKLETSLRAPAAGRVAEVFADVNTQVESGAKLLRIEPEAERRVTDVVEGLVRLIDDHGSSPPAHRPIGCGAPFDVLERATYGITLGVARPGSC